MTLSPEELAARLAGLPRLPLARYPTPLEPLPRLSAAVGRPLYVKRDDEIGPGLGGNKTRKLEFLMAEALVSGARKVVTFGGLQSNHARLTAAAARKVGLEAHLFYFERRPARLRGNLLINQALGARLHFIPLGGGGARSLDGTIRQVRLLSRLLVGPNYFIPVGGHCPTGCLGYAQAALELEQQRLSLGLERATLVLAAGSGGTFAGLLAGLHLLGSPLQLLAVDVGALWKGFAASIAGMASQVCARLGAPQRFTAAQVPLVEAEFVGPGYGLPSPAGLEAMRTAACLEGLLLDPVYTAKAFAGLLARCRVGSSNGPVIFLHTGGLPALFAFEDAYDGFR